MTQGKTGQSTEDPAEGRDDAPPPGSGSPQRGDPLGGPEEAGEQDSSDRQGS